MAPTKKPRERRPPFEGPGLREPWDGFDPDFPTPRLDHLAELMVVLLADGRPRTLREISEAIGASRSTVDHILRRPCARHGERFRFVGRKRRRKRGQAPYLWGLRDVPVAANGGADR